jgi:hypothetical protein
MYSRSWLVTTLVTLLLTGFVLIQARLRTGIPAHRTAGFGHIEYHGPARSKKPASPDQPWRTGQASHWRACLLHQGNGCLCRTDSFMVP